MGKHRENNKKAKKEGKIVTVGRVDALPPGRGATIQLKNGSEIALFNVKGTFYALENFCPHKGYPIADSRTYGNVVECEFHGWQFELTSGRCLTKRSCSIDTYDVFVEDEMIKIKV